MSTYQVTGPYAYRGHAPGEVFTARLDPSAEQRAIACGSITVLDETTPGLDPGSYRPPDGWDTPQHELTEAPAGASLIEGSNAECHL